MGEKYFQNKTNVKLEHRFIIKIYTWKPDLGYGD